VQELHHISDADRAHGKVYNADFATRMKGNGLWADLIRQRFEKTCKRLGFNRERLGHDTSQFDPGVLTGQSRLF
jgi:DNA repair photolyase